MSQEGVRRVVGRMISDPAFKKSFHVNAKSAVEKSGYSVTQDELAALQKIGRNDLKLTVAKRPIGGVESFSVETFSGVRTA